MVDRPETVWKYKSGIYYRAEFGEVEVSKDDTVTLDSFESTPTGIKKHLLIKESDGAEMASNVHATTKNRIEVTGDGTNIECVYIAYGVKA